MARAGPGVAHTFMKARAGGVPYLIVMTPRPAPPRTAALSHALHAGPVDDPAAVFAAHDSELLA